MSQSSILIVEDSKDVREVMFEMMSLYGYRVTMLADGTEALRTAINGAYDLIITDLGLPGIDGRELIERIRHAGADTPILMVTGVELKFNKSELNQYRNCDYIQKPFNLNDFGSKVESLLKMRGNNKHKSKANSDAPISKQHGQRLHLG